MDKITTIFVPLPNDTDLTSGDYAEVQRIDSFIVKATPVGNITITLRGEGDLPTGFTREQIFAPSFFVVGQVYNMNLKKVVYANETDIATPPLLGLV